MRYTALAILLTLLLATCATAQWQNAPAFDPARNNFYVRAGGAFFIGDVPNTVEPTGGIGYEWAISPRSRCSLNRTMIGFSLDYIPIKSRQPRNRTVSTMTELIYVKRTGLFGPYNSWGEIGIGAWWANRSIDEMNLHTDQNPAWMLGGGYDFTQHFFIEARFVAGWHPSDDGMFVLDVGGRF